MSAAGPDVAVLLMAYGTPRHVDEIGRLIHPDDAPRLWAAVEAASPWGEPIEDADALHDAPAETVAKAFALKAHSPDYEEVLTRTWTRIKTGL